MENESGIFFVEGQDAPNLNRKAWVNMYLETKPWMRQADFQAPENGPFTPTTGVRLPSEVRGCKWAGSYIPYTLEENVAIDYHEDANGSDSEDDDDYIDPHPGSEDCTRCPAACRRSDIASPSRHDWAKFYREMATIRRPGVSVWDDADDVVAKFIDLRNRNPELTGKDAVEIVERSLGTYSSLMTDAAIICLQRMMYYNYEVNEPRVWRLPAPNHEWANVEVNTIEVADDQVPAISNVGDVQSDQDDENVNEGSSAIDQEADTE